MIAAKMFDLVMGIDIHINPLHPRTAAHKSGRITFR